MDAREISARLEDLRAEVLVFFDVEDEPAPRGRLGRVDWILLSPLSRLRARGKWKGERGTSTLLVPDRKLKAERVLVMGVGRRAEFSMTALYRLSYQTARTVLDLQCRQIIVNLPFRLLTSEPPARIRQAFLEGFTAELTRGCPDTDFSVLTWAPPEAA